MRSSLRVGDRSEVHSAVYLRFFLLFFSAVLARLL